MQCVLFDDRGEMWDARSHQLAYALQASLEPEALAGYVVKNLGFIEVSDNRGSVHIRLRPAVVSQMAYGSLLYWLHDRPVDRVLLSMLEGEWSHELLRSREEALHRLMTRVSFDPEDRDGDFLNEERPLHALPSSSPLRAVLNAWAECAGKYDRDRLVPLMQKALNGRYVLVEAASTSSSLFIKDVGVGLSKPAEFWLKRSIGLRVEDQPDYAYGKWIARLYRRVMDSGEPNLGDVDAVIAWPQQARQSFRYRRLLLPFSSKGQSTMLLAASLTDPAIDLRVKRG